MPSQKSFFLSEFVFHMCTTLIQGWSCNYIHFMLRRFYSNYVSQPKAGHGWYVGLELVVVE